MTDRELLELAAKAAGYDFAWYCRGANNPNGIPNVPFANGHEWNPLTDDGDALRLAVKLKLNLECLGEAAQVNFIDNMHDSRHINVGAKEGLGHDPYSATRAAIVHAAAEIGKGMK